MSNTSVQSLVAILLSALYKLDRRKQLLNEFQQKIWDAPEDFLASPEGEILCDLAYDLDFYVPDITSRAEDASYYGDERVEEEIRSALKKLNVETTNPSA